MIAKWSAALGALALSLPLAAQVPVTVAPGVMGDAWEAIGSVGDAGQPGTGVLRKLLVVPPGRSLRLTDLSLVTRRADSGPSPCIVELLRGTDAGPTAAAWSRVKINDRDSYDRSWHTAPSFGPGEAIWLRASFDPFNTGLRLCVRANPNTEAEVVYALRGYLVRSHGQ
jgi:hypothetical protein